MDDMDDRELLGYAAIHCTTDRALFSREHVERILRMAGKEVPEFLPPFVNVYEHTMKPLVEEARRRTFCPGPYSGTGV